MGFLDKLKSAAAAITGGGAKVHVEIGEASIREPIKVTVKALVSDADLKIDAVYVLVKGVEEIKLDGNKVLGSLRSKLGDAIGDLPGLDFLDNDEETVDFRANISGPQQLEANQEYTWEGEVTLPPGSKPSFEGKNARHVYKMFAGLDAFGNDPDSGWVDLYVRD